MKVLNLFLHGLFLAALGFFFRDELYSLTVSWMKDPNYQHGFFVLAISIYLIFHGLNKNSKNFSSVKHNVMNGWYDKENWKNSFTLWIVVMGLSAIGLYKGVSYLNLITFLLGLRLLGFFFMGKEGSAVLNFPLFYVYLALPLPGLASITIYLQRYTAKYVSIFMLKFDDYLSLGYKVWDEGNFLHLPNFSFEIVPECTGIHSFLTLLALMVLFLGFLRLKIHQKIMIGLLCVPISLLGNFLRIITLIFVAFSFGQETSLKFWHYGGGLFFFAISLGLEFLVIAFFQRLNRRS